MPTNSSPEYPYPGGSPGGEPPDPVAGQPGHFAWSRWIKKFVQNLNEDKLAKSGDAMTGSLDVAGSISADGPIVSTDLLRVDATYPILELNTNNDASGMLKLQRDSLNRWTIACVDYTETGNDAGSNIAFLAYDDAGTAYKLAVKINRATGLATVIGPPTADLGIATKKYVDDTYESGTYTPVWSQDGGAVLNIGNGTINGYWVRSGKMVTAVVYVVRGSTTNIGSAHYLFSLPFPADPWIGLMGIGSVYTGSYDPVAVMPVTSSVVRLVSTANNVIVGHTFKSWASGNAIYFSITYRIN